jgi:hypothetical protein
MIHLNEWLGVGKLTVGRALADRLGARLIDNHPLHDVAIRCTRIDDMDRWPLYARHTETAGTEPASDRHRILS